MSWKNKDDRWAFPWHVGDGEVDFGQRVVTVQLDGHELEMLYSAMRNAYVGENSRVGMNGESH